MDPVEEYVEALDEPHRSTVRATLAALSELLPEADRCLAYGAPAFRLGGKAVAGVSAAKQHLSYLPHSGNVLAAVADQLAGHQWSKGALKFPVDEPLPVELLRVLVEARRREL